MTGARGKGLTDVQMRVLECLERAVRRDAEKGGGGYRSTAEVAERVGLTTDQARRVLYSLADAGLVALFDTTPLDWITTDLGRSALTPLQPAKEPR